MTLPQSQPGARTLPQLLLLAYIVGTIAAAIALHVAVAVVAPGDAGTASPLGSGVILIPLAVIVAIYCAVPFLLMALLSWPLRRVAYSHPLAGAFLATVAGAAVGALASLFDVRVGPGDNWSGPLVGGVYGLVWFLFVHKLRRGDREKMSRWRAEG